MTSDRRAADLPQRPRPLGQGVFRRHPVASRAATMIAGFLVLVPLGWLVRPDNRRPHVSARGLAGAAVASPAVEEGTASAAVTTTEPPSTVPLVTDPPIDSSTAAPVTTTPSTVAAATGVPSTARPSTATVRPVVTVSKPAATTVKPATVTPATTREKPVPTTAKPKPAPTTVKPVVTTVKPAPTTVKPIRQYSSGDVETLIRQLWPADSVDKALDVAWRESNFKAGAYNGWCCYGVFQLNFSAHRSRLAARGLGLESLYDPKVNIEIALEIFREQGWLPWAAA